MGNVPHNWHPGNPGSFDRKISPAQERAEASMLSVEEVRRRIAENADAEKNPAPKESTRRGPFRIVDDLIS